MEEIKKEELKENRQFVSKEKNEYPEEMTQKPKDTIVIRYEYETTQKDDEIITKRKMVMTNIDKKINETAKTIEQENVEERIERIVEQYAEIKK